YQADPVVITVEVDNWEAEPVYQLPAEAPTELVVKRVDLTKMFDAYRASVAKVRELMQAMEFEPTKEQLEALDAARLDAEETLAALQEQEQDFVQEKNLYESDPGAYVAGTPVAATIAKN